MNSGIRREQYHEQEGHESDEDERCRSQAKTRVISDYLAPEIGIA